MKPLRYAGVEIPASDATPILHSLTAFCIFAYMLRTTVYREPVIKSVASRKPQGVVLEEGWLQRSYVVRQCRKEDAGDGFGGWFVVLCCLGWRSYPDIQLDGSGANGYRLSC